jgi:lipopolysaccharide export system protein LptA
MMDHALRVFLVFALAFLHLLGGAGFSAGSNLKKNQGSEEGPLVVTSSALEIDNEKKTVTFTGNVTAKKDDWIIHSDKMVLFYNEETARSVTDTENVRVDKIIAIGNVQILQSGGGEALAQEAVYYQADERIILTGKPVVKQGEDLVEGSRITLFLQDNRSIVEGSEQEKVRAVIMPRSEKR